MAGQGSVARKKGHKNRKHGRSLRGGQKAGTLKNRAGQADRKRKRIAKSNGPAFLAAWNVARRERERAMA